MQKKSFILVFVLALILTAQPVFAQDSHSLEPSDYAFTQEYDSISLPSYLLDGEVYVPMQIFSDFFGTTIGYNAKTQSIELGFGLADGREARLKTFAQFVQNTERDVRPSPHKVLVQGSQTDIPMVLIDGYNFIQIDTAAEAYGYRAVKDTKAKTIGLTQDDWFQSPNLPQFKEDLAKNQIEIKTNELKELSNAAFDPYEVYLIGEQHGIAKNFDIQLYFIKYFYTHQNVRFILIEDSFCNGMLLNRYLETGDTSIIDHMVKAARGSSAYSKEYYDFYVNLYEFNKTLPKDQKLCFVGIDVQHNRQAGIDYLVSMFDGKSTAPKAVSDALAALKGHTEEGVRAAERLFNANQDVFAAYFGDRFNEYKFALRSVIQGYNFYEKSDFEVREQYIHENFRDYYEAFKIEKCFGMFGGAHTQLDGSFGDISNLASFMNNEHPAIKGKVCSIMTNYIDCFYMDPTSGERIPVTYSHSQALNMLLKETAKSDLALFPLEREGSTFMKSGFTKGFQYYLTVKNSPAATPYGSLSN